MVIDRNYNPEKRYISIDDFKEIIPTSNCIHRLYRKEEKSESLRGIIASDIFPTFILEELKNYIKVKFTTEVPVRRSTKKGARGIMISLSSTIDYGGRKIAVYFDKEGNPPPTILISAFSHILDFLRKEATTIYQQFEGVAEEWGVDLHSFFGIQIFSTEGYSSKAHKDKADTSEWSVGVVLQREEGSKGSNFVYNEERAYLNMRPNTLFAFRSKTDLHGTTIPENKAAESTIVIAWTMTKAAHYYQKDRFQALHVGQRLTNLSSPEVKY